MLGSVYYQNKFLRFSSSQVPALTIAIIPSLSVLVLNGLTLWKILSRKTDAPANSGEFFTFGPDRRCSGRGSQVMCAPLPVFGLWKPDTSRSQVMCAPLPVCGLWKPDNSRSQVMFAPLPVCGLWKPENSGHRCMGRASGPFSSHFKA